MFDLVFFFPPFWTFLEVIRTLTRVKIDIFWLWCNPMAVSKVFFLLVQAQHITEKGNWFILAQFQNPGLMRECLHILNQIENKQGWIIFKSQHAFNQSRPAAAHEKKTFLGFPSYNYLFLISAPFYTHMKFQRNFISSLLLKWIDTRAFL